MLANDNFDGKGTFHRNEKSRNIAVLFYKEALIPRDFLTDTVSFDNIN